MSRLTDYDGFPPERLAVIEADAIVQSTRLEAERCLKRIQQDEERLDRLELMVFRRTAFLHNSAKASS